MNKSNFTKIKNIFVEGGVFDYVNLDKSIFVYEKVIKSLQKPLKLILFFGKPGTGKTFLLQKVHKDLKHKQPIIFFPQPFFNEEQFLIALYEKIFAETAPNFSGYEEFLKIFTEKKITSEESVIVLLDEAQLYPSELIEKIRLMADTRKFKFLFTVHKTEKEDTLAKDYFTTRIWESIEMPNSTQDEIRLYLEKKFLFHNLFEYINIFSDKQIKLIFRLTKGNLRTLNKLMFKVFEICEFYEYHKPSLIKSNQLSQKYIYMAAISTGLLNA